MEALLHEIDSGTFQVTGADTRAILASALSALVSERKAWNGGASPMQPPAHKAASLEELEQRLEAQKQRSEQLAAEHKAAMQEAFRVLCQLQEAMAGAEDRTEKEITSVRLIRKAGAYPSQITKTSRQRKAR